MTTAVATWNAAGARAPLREPSVIPGFGLTLGLTLEHCLTRRST